MMKNIPFAEIIELARLAPSGDNLQPWNFNIQDNNLVLKYKPSPVEEPAYFETGVYCSMGIMIEYVILAAKSLGFQVETEIKSDFVTSLDKQVAVFTFTESPTIDNDSSRLVEAMPKRHTAREPYLKKSLVESARTELEYSVTEKSGLIKWVEDDGGRNLITKFLEISDKQFWSRKDTRRALIESIYTENEEPGRDFGMPTTVLNAGLLTPFLKKFFLLAEKFPLLFTPIHLKSTEDIKQGIYHSSAVGFLTVPTSTVNGLSSHYDHIVGGQLITRLWLTATANGLVIQPLYHFVAMTANENNHSLGEEFIKTNKRALGLLNKILPWKDNQTLVFAFRIGYPNIQNISKGSTPRYPLSKILN